MQIIALDRGYSRIRCGALDLQRLIRPRLSQPTLWRVLDGLRAAGQIVVEGHGRATRYHAIARNDVLALRGLRLHQQAAHRLAADPDLRGIVRERSPEERRRVFEAVRVARPLRHRSQLQHVIYEIGRRFDLETGSRSFWARPASSISNTAITPRA